MSGHSKWANIKHKKTAQDAKKSKGFSRVSNLIALAAKQGNDPDPKTNSYLRDAIAKAKEINMPQDNISRAIKRGLGQIPGMIFEELVLEAYGPEGIAVLIKAATDNRNRTIAEIRKIISNAGGNLAESGSVLYLFKEMVKIEVDKQLWQKYQGLELEVIDLGAEDILENDLITILCPKNKLSSIRELLEKRQIPAETEIIYSTENPQTVSPEAKEKIEHLVVELEERDDVLSVYTNINLD
ncbi:MAG: YebC/PmpR family DNA-binding transcriptional regulator [Patescibacteria group bacterium]